MAFVALTAAVLIFQGKSGRTYNIPITRASSVGLVTFAQDGTTTWYTPEEVMLVDGYIGDSINAADYLDTYVNNIVRPQLRVMEKLLTNVTATKRVTGQWIASNAAVSFYHYSA
jgi:hypothetical protein